MAEEIIGGGDMVASPFSKVLLKNNGEYFTWSEGEWINLGSDKSSIKGAEQGVSLSDMNSTDWWKHFSGEVEILLYSSEESPDVSAYIMYYTSTDIEDLIPTAEIDSLSPEIAQMDSNERSLLLIGHAGTDNSKEVSELKIDSAATEEMNLDGDSSILIEGEIRTDMSEVKKKAAVEIDSGSTEDMELEGERSLLMEGFETTYAMEAIDDFSIDVGSSIREDMKLNSNYSVLMEGLSTVDNESQAGDIEVQSSQEDGNALEQDLNLIGEASAQIRSAISIDGGDNFWTYNTVEMTWQLMDLRDIDFEGMDQETLNSLDYFDFKKLVENRIYLKDLVVATQVTNTLEEEETFFRGLEVEYLENQPAFIKETSLTPDQIHNEYAELRFTVGDLEGDDIFYKVMVKRAGEEEYKQVDPSSGEWKKRKNGDRIFHAYNHPYFNTGLNKIKVVVRDSRGESTEQEFDLHLLNDKPWISLSHNKFGMSLVVGDNDMDSVSYKVSVNDETILDYTHFQAPPIDFEYSWRLGQLSTEEMNIVRVEVIDTHGEKSVEEFEVGGQYAGLMFADESGEYLTDDLGELLRHLDFGAVVGGTSSPTKTVRVMNETGIPIKDVEVEMLGEKLSQGVDAEFSQTFMPFEGSNMARFKGVLPYQGSHELYVRVRTAKDVSGLNHFEARGKAETDL
ncbi:hypothetical protein [Bacillus atrophaeus]|uniref:hypothetical protein n=1 Tax=Bacillus atrophaeus TaxID=1452 RepID=UPI002E24C620|nr:hypothetical protein [Bacillus atrophaeus]